MSSLQVQISKKNSSEEKENQSDILPLVRADPKCSKNVPQSHRGVDQKFVPLVRAGWIMNQLRKEKKLADVTIVCDNENFSAHRIILAAFSPFFRDLLTRDSLQNSSSTLVLEDVQKLFLEILLEFMYTGQIILASLSKGHIINLLTSAHLLQITDAPPCISNEMLQTQPDGSIVVLWQWAKDYNNTAVEQVIINFITKNFASVCKLSDFAELSLEKFTTILMQPTLSLHFTPDTIVEAIVTWAKHDKNERANNLEMLLRYVSTRDLSRKFRSQLKADPFMKCCPKFLADITFDLWLDNVKNNQQTTIEDNGIKCTISFTTPLTCQKVTESTVWLDDLPTKIPKQNSKVRFENFQSDTESEHYEPDMDESAESIASEKKANNMNLENNVIVLIAGRDDGNRFVWQCYIPSRNTWTVAQEVDIPVNNKEGFAYFEGQMYFIGGETDNKVKLRDLYIFDLSSHLLQQSQPLWLARALPTIIQSEQSIFAIGGVSRFDKPMTHVECFNCKSKMWKILPPIKEKRHNPGTAVIGSNVYLIGGGTQRCEYYDNKIESWNSIPSLPNSFQNAEMISAAFNEKLYTFRSFCPDRVCYFDSARYCWQTSKTMNRSPDSLLAAAPGQNHIWFLDKACKLYLFDTDDFSWELVTALPHQLKKPRHISVLRMGELKVD